MALPKGYRNDIKIVQGKIGVERRQEILDDITYKDTFLPKSVFEEDMDKSFVDYVSDNNGFSLVIEGKNVPVIFLTIQRWTEFTKTWQFTDEYKNIEMPFITVVRRPDIQQGQNQAGLWNIPGKKTYTYMKVPSWDGVRRGITLYKIPQPTPVDITYEVRLFTNRMKDLNKFNRIIQKAFQSRQCYLNVKGHPMPLLLENIGDESNIDNFENRRFYVQLFEMRLMGYLLDEDDFEVVPTINRTIMALEVEEKILVNEIIPVKKGNELTYTFVWKPKSTNKFTFTAQYDVLLTKIINIENITRIIIKVNGLVVFDGTTLNSPIILNANDVVNVEVSKNYYSLGQFIMIGNTTS